MGQGEGMKSTFEGVGDRYLDNIRLEFVRGVQDRNKPLSLSLFFFKKK